MSPSGMENIAVMKRQIGILSASLQAVYEIDEITSIRNLQSSVSNLCL
jgi:hypothetical protein